MDPFEMVVAIVFIATIGKLLHAWINRHQGEGVIDDSQQKALREEVAHLKDRVKVLERIAIEGEDTLTRQIEELRDR